ncbi:hypothetical protein GCM10023094_22660 [Rhodococcus olei]|uniref:Uncharacterized protein n=1 Tax=Rhodococcus olei TaxID=2161675 RepID=A0ABP8P2Z9_9NOCA
MTNEFDPTGHTDDAVRRATRVIGLAAALVLGITIGVATADVTAPDPGDPTPCDRAVPSAAAPTVE